MSPSIGYSALDPATEDAFIAACRSASTRSGHAFEPVAGDAATHVVVDMDTGAGPLEWLRLHAQGKQVVGLSASDNVQTRFRLPRPFDETAVVALIRQIGGVADTEASYGVGPQPTADPEISRLVEDVEFETDRISTADEDASIAFADNGSGDGADRIGRPDAAQCSSTPESPASPESSPEKPADGHGASPARKWPDNDSDSSGSRTVFDLTRPPPIREPTLVDWLRPGALTRRVRFQSDGSPTIWLDGPSGSYYGPARLNPLRTAFDGPVHPKRLEEVDDATWTHGTAALGQAQPFSRLRWYGTLLAGNGELMSDHTPSARYQLNRWSQYEREFPRHLRIAICMLKSPSSIAEIVRESGATVAEVNDFVNAGLVTGFVTVSEPEEQIQDRKKGGFFSRLRRKD